MNFVASNVALDSTRVEKVAVEVPAIPKSFRLTPPSLREICPCLLRPFLCVKLFTTKQTTTLPV